MKLLCIYVTSSWAASGDLSQSFTLEGELYDSPAGSTPLLGQATIQVRILDPSKTCVLYAEEQLVDTTLSNGIFNIQVGSAPGAGKRVPMVDPGNSMVSVFQNTIPVTATGCGGGTFTPNPAGGEGRYVEVSVTPIATGVTDVLSPEIYLGSIPSAIVAQTLQGYAPADLLRLGTVAPLTQANLENVFSVTNYPVLQSLLASGGSNFTANAVINADSDGNATGAVQFNINGSTKAEVKNDGDFAVDGNSLYVDAATNSVGIGTSTPSALLTLKAGTAAAGTAPLKLTAGTNLTTPEIGAIEFDGTNLYYTDSTATRRTLQTNATSVVTNSASLANGKIWIGDAGGKAQEFALTGDVTMTNGGVTTVDAVATNTASKIVKRDASGNFAANDVTVNKVTAATSLVLKDSGSNSVTLAAPAAVTTSYTLKWPVATAAGDAGKVLSTDASGNLSWLALSNVPGGSASGDLSGTYPGPTVAKIQGVGVSSAAPTSSQILIFDGTNYTPTSLSGAATLAANGTLTLATVPIAKGGTGLTTSAASSVLTTTALGAYQNTTCMNNEFIQFDTILGIKCGTLPSLTNTFSNNGNSFGGAATLGTNDNQPLIFETNGTDKVTILANGNVGIGSVSPNRLLEVAGPVRITPTALPGSPAAGDLAFDSGASNALKFYDGSSWQTVGTGTGSGDFKADGSVPMTAALQATAGTAALPAVTFGDSDTGFYAVAGNSLSLSTGGIERIRFSSGTVQSQQGNAYLLGIGSSAASPTYTFNDGVSTSGMYRAAANSLGFSTAGTERVRIDSAGNVGIGTSPGTILDVVGAITSRPYGTATGNTGQLIMRELAANGTNTATIRSPDSIAANYVLTLPADDGTANQVLTTDGSGGLSWTTPAAGGGGGGLPAADGTPSAPTINFTNATDSGFFHSGLGEIGLTIGSQYFWKFGANIEDMYLSGGASIQVGGNVPSYPAYSFVGDPDTGMYRSGVNEVSFVTGGVGRVLISSTGLGVGSTVPAARIHQDSGNATATAHKFTAGTTTGLLSTDGFNVGIDASGNAEIKQLENLEMRFFTNNSRVVTIQNDGDFGIGTNTPGEKLEVNGNVKATAFISTSDRRLKTNIEKMPGLDLIRQLMGVRYLWKKDGVADFGVIAQDVEKVIPEAVVTDTISGYKAVKYPQLVAPLIEATKELENMNQRNSQELSDLRLKNEKLITRISELEARIKQIESLLKK